MKSDINKIEYFLQLMEVTDGVKMVSWGARLPMAMIRTVQHVEGTFSVFHIRMDAHAQQDIKG